MRADQRRAGHTCSHAPRATQPTRVTSSALPRVARRCARCCAASPTRGWPALQPVGSCRLPRDRRGPVVRAQTSGTAHAMAQPGCRPARVGLKLAADPRSRGSCAWPRRRCTLQVEKPPTPTRPARARACWVHVARPAATDLARGERARHRLDQILEHRRQVDGHAGVLDVLDELRGRLHEAERGLRAAAGGVAHPTHQHVAAPHHSAGADALGHLVAHLEQLQRLDRRRPVT